MTEDEAQARIRRMAEIIDNPNLSDKEKIALMRGVAKEKQQERKLPAIKNG